MRPKKVSRVPQNAKQPLGLLPGRCSGRGRLRGVGGRVKRVSIWPRVRGFAIKS